MVTKKKVCNKCMINVSGYYSIHICVDQITVLKRNTVKTSNKIFKQHIFCVDYVPGVGKATAFENVFLNFFL